MSEQCSVVVRAFNEERFVAKLLTGIRQQQGVETEVILVDSGSTDATVAIAHGFGSRIVHIAPDEFTFGRALNLGIAHASHESVVLASAHVYPVYRDWLTKLLLPLIQSDVGVSYGRQIGNELTKYSEQRLFSKWFPDQSESRQRHPFCNNANAALRRSTWEKYRYDEQLTGLEDLELAKRLLADGLHVSYVADATVVHVHEETPARVYNRYRREAFALAQIMPGEKMSLLDLVRLWTGNSVSDLYHAALDRNLARNWWEIPLFRAMQFCGAYRGFRQKGEISSDLRYRFYYPAPFARTQTADESDRPRVDYADETDDDGPGST